MKELTLEITNNCSLNCIQCSTMAGKTGEVFFSLDDTLFYLNKFPDFKSVRLSGGEPFQHPQIRDIARLIHEQGRLVTILSCGVQAGEEIKEETFKQIKPYVHELVFSIHGFYLTHDMIVTSTHSEGSALRHPPYRDMLADSADNARYLGINISFQTVLMQSNYGSLRKIARGIDIFSELSKKTLDWHILRFVKQGRGEVNADQALTDQQLTDLPDILDSLSKQYKVRITKTKSFDLQECNCGSEKAVVTCYKEIIPCSALKYGADSGRFACKDRI